MPTKLKRFVVPVQLIVLAGDEDEATQYAAEALETSDILDQDGIVAYDDEIDPDDVFPQEEA